MSLPAAGIAYCSPQSSREVCPAGAKKRERMMAGITFSRAPAAACAICPGWKVPPVEFLFLCTLSPSLPTAAS